MYVLFLFHVLEFQTKYGFREREGDNTVSIQNVGLYGVGPQY